MITKDNYQEFFLLYVDNELSAKDRIALEEWIAAHPEVQEEWETLQQCRLLPEPAIVFRDKSSLFSYEEDFLSYIDGELDAKDRSRIEELILAHPSKQSELDLLRHTVSIPDTTIVFPDKELLYRKERDRRVIVLYRQLIGAAAVVMGIAALLLLQRGHVPRHTIEPTIVKVSPGPVPVDNKKDTSTVTPATAAALYPIEERKKKEGGIVKQQRQALPTNRVEEAPPLIAERRAPEKQERKTAGLATVSDRNPTIISGSNPAGIDNTTTHVDNMASRVDNMTNALASVQHVNIPREQSSFATQALLKEDNENEIVATTSEPAQGKSKLRGLFRKVTRTFGKTADQDGEGRREVLINAFQVAVN